MYTDENAVDVDVASSVTTERSVSYAVVVVVMAMVSTEVNTVVSEMVCVAGRVAALLQPEMMAFSGYAAKAVGVAIARFISVTVGSEMPTTVVTVVVSTTSVSVDTKMAVEVVVVVKRSASITSVDTVTVAVTEGIV